MATAAERFAGFALELDLDAVPDEVVEAAKLHVLDVIGCGLAAHGLGIAGEGRDDDDRARRHGKSDRDRARRPACPAPNAAFANAMLCHGLDFDDTHSDSVAHVSTVVVPAAAALAEARGASGRELLTAIIAGNEIVTRIGMATPGAFHKRGFHPTAICGIFGATAAAARLGGSTPSRRRARSGSPAAWPPASSPTSTTRPRRSRSTPPGQHTARCSPRGSRRTAPRGRPGCWRGASASSTPSSTRGSTSSPSSPTWALAGRRPASPTSRSPPATSSTARSARPGRSPDDLDPDEIEDVARHHPGGGRLARARAGRPQDRAAHRLRGQVLAPVLDRGDARARPRRADDVHARGVRRRARARPGAQGALRDEGVRVVSGSVPRRRPDHAEGRAHVSRPTSPTSSARPRTR